MNEINTCVISLEQWDYFNKMDGLNKAIRNDNVFTVYHDDYDGRLILINPDEAVKRMKEVIDESSKRIVDLEGENLKLKQQIDELQNPKEIVMPRMRSWKFKCSWF